MPTAVFAKGYRHGGRLYIPGDRAELPKEDFDGLARRGIVTAPGSGTDSAAAKESAKAVDDKPTKKETKTTTPRPAKAAGVDKWRAYAESLGHNVNGLDKSEIIALVS